jgi:hypothetical protein
VAVGGSGRCSADRPPLPVVPPLPPLDPCQAVALSCVGSMMILSEPNARCIHVSMSPAAMSAFSPACSRVCSMAMLCLNAALKARADARQHHKRCQKRSA